MFKKIPVLLVVGFVALVLSYMAGCDNGGVSGEQQHPPGWCETSDDCSIGEICVSNTCVNVSNTDGDGSESDGDVSGEIESETENDKVVEPNIVVSPNEIEFGSVLFGDERIVSFSVGNTGNANLIISSAYLREDSSQDFSFPDEPQSDVVIEPESSINWHIKYKPTNVGADEGWLVIESNDPDTPTLTVHIASDYKGTVSIAVDPLALEFGNVRVATTSQMILTVKNERVGEDDNRLLVIDSISISPDTETSFAVDLGDNSLPIYIAPGHDVTLMVNFTPLAEEEYSATLILNNNDPDEEDQHFEVPLSGKGVLPHISVSPDPAAFGNVKLSQESTLDVHIDNTGDAALNISSVELDAASSPYFAIKSMPQIPGEGYLLANTDEFVLTLSYTPEETGEHTGTLIINSDDPDTPTYRLSITGTGIITGLSVEPASVDFGRVRVGTESDAIELTVTNTSEDDTAVVNITNISFVDNPSDVFSVLDAPSEPVPLAKGESFTFHVKYSPMDEAIHQGMLEIVSDNTGGNPQVPLRGEGALPHVSLSPADELDFGEVVLGKVGHGIITVSNSGNWPLTISDITITAGSSEYFAVQVESSQLPLVVPANSSVDVEFTFAPPSDGTTGEFSGAAVFSTDDSDFPQLTVSLNALGVKPLLEVVPADDIFDLGRVVVSEGCQSEVLEVKLRNVGAMGTLRIEGIETVIGTHPSFHIEGLPAGYPVLLRPYSETFDELTFTITYVPTGADIHHGWLRIRSNAWNIEERTLEMQGEGYLCAQGMHVCSCQCVANNSIEHCGDSCEPCPTDRSFADPTCELDLTTGMFACGYQCWYGYVEQDDQCVPANAADCCGSSCIDCTADPRIPEHGIAICTEDYSCDFICESGYHRCGDSCFADDDAFHCGENCDDCSVGIPLNSSPVCVNGRCDYVCNDGFHECQDGLCYLDTDTSHCGAACMVCEDPDNGAAICENGTCDFECDTCYHKEGSGCFANTSTSHCGRNDEQCDVPDDSNARAVCDGSGDPCDYSCSFECLTGWADCDPGSDVLCETHIATDPNNCGACFHICDLPNTNEHYCAYDTQTSSYECRVSSCDMGFGNCDNDHSNGCEAIFATDDDNCGACGHKCNALPNVEEAHCAGGGCVIVSCDPSWGNCNPDVEDGCETYLVDNVEHCGNCANQCTVPDSWHASPVCAGTVCSYECNIPYTDCSDAIPGCESDTSSDENNCGSCGNVCPSYPNSNPVCENSQCSYECGVGWKDCNGVASDGCEININTDVDNCGSCGNVCPNAPAGSHKHRVCNAGTCGLECDDGYHECAGWCYSNTDPDHCGTSCNVCPNGPHTQQRTCEWSDAEGDYECGFVCEPNWGDCTTADGCETDLTTVSNCGACGNACTSAPEHAVPICTNDGSGYACDWQCETGWHKVGDHCERNDDPSCCGNACLTCTSGSNSTPVCTWDASLGDYTCGCECDSGFANCDGSCINGCEINITTTSNCGACGNSCTGAPAHAHNLCTNTNGNYECSWECDNGYHRCGDACYADSDASHCGDACNDCYQQNVNTASCINGQCVINSCDSGYADCNNDWSNGCETDITTDANCGGCGIDCDSADNVLDASCNSGSCQINSCDSGYADCNNNWSDGCETNTRTNELNCGGCGINCNSADNVVAGNCNNGTCEVATCSSGYADCNDDWSDGCEKNLNTDPNNCGWCGHSCDGRPHVNIAGCSNGSCTIDSCDSGYYDCNSSWYDGCEVTHSTYSNTCAGATTMCRENSYPCDTDICGDDESQSTNVYYGRNSAWFKIDIDECVRAIWDDDFTVTISLGVPGGVHYDLYVYDGCSGNLLKYSNNGTGIDENVCVGWDDSSGDDSKTLWIKVVYYSGHSCSNWELSVQGNTDCND